MPNPIINRRIVLNNNVIRASLSSSASNVDGLFHVTVVYERYNPGRTINNFTVTNGTAEYLTTTNSVTYTLMVMPDAAGNVTISTSGGNTITVTINTSWQYIAHNSTSEMYYDMRELVGLTNYVITSTDPALSDLSGNSRSLSLINAPLISSATAGITRFQDATTKCLSTGVTGSTIFNKNFSIIISVGSNDGQQTSNWDLFGNYDGTNTGVIGTITTVGKLQVQYQGFTWLSTSAVFPNGATSVSAFAMHFDFTNDTFTVTQDGGAVAGSFTVSDIASVNPASYACTANFYLGAYNNNGTASSNPTNSHLYYFTVTDLQTSQTSGIVTYLNAKKPVLELVDTLVDATYLKYPHDIIISSDGTKAYVSGKGHPTLTTVDGSFAVIDLTTPTTTTVLGGYANQADQQDGETVLELSSTKVIHFVDDNALVLDVSNPASITKSQTVANSAGVINGAIMVGSYIFGANKGGFIDVFTWSGSALAFVGGYDTNAASGMVGPHDIDVCSDNEHIIICSKTTGAQFACYKVFNAGTFIPIASWTPTFTPINSAAAPNLKGSNRIRRQTIDGSDIAVLHQLTDGAANNGNNVATYNIDNKATPVYLDSFNLSLSVQRGSTGACLYRGKLTFTGDDQGLRLLDLSDPSNIIERGGYFNSTEFSVGSNNNLHDCECFSVSGQNYCIVTAQNEGIAVFKINRI